MILNNEFLFVFPFVDSTKFAFTESTKSKLTKIFELEKYDKVDFSNDEKSILPISIEIKLQEGTKVVKINKSENDHLTEEEKVKRYHKASVFKIINDTNIN